MQKPTDKKDAKLIRLTPNLFDKKNRPQNHQKLKGEVIQINSSKPDNSKQDDFITLVWLFCPNCHSLEYSNVLSKSGRLHNLCGSKVLEKPVKLTAQVEYDIAKYNTKHQPKIRQKKNITDLDKKVDDSIKKFKAQMSEYAKIVQAAAVKELNQFDYPTLLKRVTYYVDEKRAIFDDLHIAHSIFFINSQSLFDKN